MPENMNARRRSFVPAQNEDERRLMHRVEELCRIAQSRSMPRYTGFLSDREQALAVAAMNRAGCTFGRFWGGFDSAERKVLCLEPPDTWQEEPVCAIKLCVNMAAGEEPPAHRDCLGALLGLGIERRSLGDLVLDADTPGGVYLFALEEMADFILRNLTEIGRRSARAERCDALPDAIRQEPERVLCEATVPSLRADTVLAAMMHTSRGIAAQRIEAGKVEINHLPLRTAHEAVYTEDVFTVRGTGRYRLAAIGGKSRKDRIFISYYQY